MNESIETLDIARVIRNRLTVIALCTDSLEVAFRCEVSRAEKQQFAVIQSSIRDIKLVLDRMAGCFQAELLALKQRQRGGEWIGGADAARSDQRDPTVTN